MQLSTKPNRSDFRNPTGLYPRALSIEELRALLGPHTAPCVSLYLPSRRGGSSEDRNRFEALLAQAHMLLRKELGEADVERLLEPVRLLSKPDFWREQTEGLAVFHSADHSALP